MADGWDDDLRAERARRAELERRRSPHRSPWEIGTAHWDQRDLYTRNARIDEGGYGRGPQAHPDVGSYAYRREAPLEHRRKLHDFRSFYEREAWPWLHYGDESAVQVEAGSGPKNWTRPDARIRDDVCDALAWRDDLDATDIEVTVEDGEVTLKGTVRDRHSKRVAEECAEGCLGVVDVHNRLKVRPDDTNDADIAYVMPLRAT